MSSSLFWSKVAILILVILFRTLWFLSFFLDSFDFKVSQFLCVYTLCGVEQTLSLYLVILRGMRVTPLGVCLRVIANKNPLNLEKTTSICVVINLWLQPSRCSKTEKCLPSPHHIFLHRTVAHQKKI